MTSVSEPINSSASNKAQAVVEKQVISGIDESIAKIISAISGKAVSPADLKDQQISEDVMYAALVHQKLEESNPEVAKALLERLPKRFGKTLDNKARQPLFRAVDTIMNREITRGNLQRSDKARIVRSSFAEAQVDGKKRRLANRTDNGRSVAGSEASEVVAKNEGKSAKRATMVAFRQRLQDRPKLGNAMHQHLSTRFDNIGKSTESKAPESVSDTKGVNTDKFDPNEIRSDKFDFVYNPASKDTGNVNIMLPIAYSKEVQKVGIFSGDTLVAELKFDKMGEDGRAHWIHDSPGNSLPDNISVKMMFFDDSVLPYDIGNPAEVFKRKVSATQKH